MVGLADLAEGFLLGTEEDVAGRASQGVLGSLTAAVTDAPKVFSNSLSMATLLGGVGEGFELLGAITGEDFLTGGDMPAWERVLNGIAPIAGPTVLGAAVVHANGMPSWGLLNQGRRGLPRRWGRPFQQMPVGGDDIRVARVVRNFEPDQVMADELRRLNHEANLRTPERTFMTTSQRTNDLLAADGWLDPETGQHAGYAQIGEVLANPTSGNWSAAKRNIEAFAADLSTHIAERLPSFQGARRASMVDDSSAMNATQWVIATWDHAMEMHKRRDVTKFQLNGTVANDMFREWNKLLDGADTVDLPGLTENIVKWAEATDWIGHPELSINPLMSVAGVNLDGAHGVVSFNILQFDRVNWEDLSSAEINRRLSAIFKMNEASMVGIIADNLRVLLDEMIGKPDNLGWGEWATRFNHLPDEIAVDNPQDLLPVLVSEYRRWYEDARQQLRTISDGMVGRDFSVHLADPDRAQRYLITVASILSAGEDWDTNVAKAADVLNEIDRMRKSGFTFDMMLEDIQSSLKVSSDDLARVLLLEGVDDPIEVFVTGTKGKGSKTLSELGPMIVEGGMDPREAAQIKKISNHWDAMKQPSFGWAIDFSKADDLDEQRIAMALLMAGEFGSETDLRLGEGLGEGSINQLLPLVADRQHFKAGIGFSLNPGTWFSTNRQAYTQFAQAARIIAAEIGEVVDPVTGLATQVTPSEVQALVWMRWRARAHKADALGRPLPRMEMRATDIAELDLPYDPTGAPGTTTLRPEQAQRIRELLEPELPAWERKIAKWHRYDDALEQWKLDKAEWERGGKLGKQPPKPRKPSGSRPDPPSVRTIEGGRSAAGRGPGLEAGVGGIASFRQGRGPELIFSNTVMELVDGSARYGTPDVVTVTASNDLTAYAQTLDEFEVIPSTLKNAVHTLELEPTDTGFHWLHDGDLVESQKSVPLHATRAKVHGKQVLRPNYPQRIASAPKVMEQLNDTTVFADAPDRNPRAAMTGARMKAGGTTPEPIALPGAKMRIGAMESMGTLGGTGAHAHRRLAAEFRKNGIGFRVVDTDTYTGMSYVYTLGSDPDDVTDVTWLRDEAARRLGPDVDLDTRLRQHGEVNRYDRWFLFDSVSDAWSAREVMLAENVQGNLFYLGANDFRRQYVRGGRRSEVRISDPSWVHGVPDLNPGQMQPSDIAALWPETRLAARYTETIQDINASMLGRSIDDDILDSFRMQVRKQFEYLVTEMGVTVEVVGGLGESAPYLDMTSAQNLLQDLVENDRVQVPLVETHPYLRFDEELGVHEAEMFAAVHAVFGHAMANAGFDRLGNETALYAHLQMFSDDVIDVLAAETRGRNAVQVWNDLWDEYDNAMAEWKAAGSKTDTRDGGTFFHGSFDEIPALEPTTDAGSDFNLYGPGFYTTDAADVAADYRHKEADQNLAGRPGNLYRVEELAPVQFLDLESEVDPTDITIGSDAPVPQVLFRDQPVTGGAAEALARLAEDRNFNEFGGRTVQDMLDEGIVTFDQINRDESFAALGLNRPSAFIDVTDVKVPQRLSDVVPAPGQLINDPELGAGIIRDVSSDRVVINMQDGSTTTINSRSPRARNMFVVQGAAANRPVVSWRGHRIEDPEVARWLFDAKMADSSTAQARRFPKWRSVLHFNNQAGRDMQAIFEAEGYGGYAHIGGAITGTDPHQVHIYWHPHEQLELHRVSNADLPGGIKPIKPAVPKPPAANPVDSGIGALPHYLTGDLHAAWLEQPGMNQRLIDTMFNEDVADITWHFDADTDAADGLMPAWEYHYEDPTGAKVMHLNTAGSSQRHNAYRVYLEPGEPNLGGLVGDTTSDFLRPGARQVNRSIETYGGSQWWDNRIMISPTGPDQELGWANNKRYQWWDVTVDGDPVTEVWIGIIEPGAQPVMAFGPDGGDVLAANMPRQRIVQVRQKIKVNAKGEQTPDRAGLIVAMPNLGRDQADPILYGEVRELIDTTQSQTAAGLKVERELLS